MLQQGDKERFWLGSLAISWGPVVCFIAICFGTYLHAHKKKACCFEELMTRYERLACEKQEAISIRHDLQLQIESQSDPLWIEQTLMRGLGLVPEGQKKIIFREK